MIILGVLLTLKTFSPLYVRHVCIGLADLEANCFFESTHDRSLDQCIRNGTHWFADINNSEMQKPESGHFAGWLYTCEVHYTVGPIDRPHR
jgi:hypothetical protein